MTKWNRSLRVERLEHRLLLAGDTYLINFQPAGASIPTRYAADTGEVFGLRSNGWSYGWSSDHTTVARDREAHLDQRLDTLIHFHQGQAWELALPNGLYEVTAAIGDASFSSTHTLNVEGVNYWNAVALSAGDFRVKTMQVTVNDGRLTLNQGAAGEMATRINYIHVVGLPNGPNASPATPTIMEPVMEGEEVNPADVHMEAVGFSDPRREQSPVDRLGNLDGRRVPRAGLAYAWHYGRREIAHSLGRWHLRKLARGAHGFDFRHRSQFRFQHVHAHPSWSHCWRPAHDRGRNDRRHRRQRTDLSGMVDAFTLLSPTNQNLMNDGSFELAVPDTQTSNSNWVMTAQSDGVEPAAQFQTAPWAASSGNKGVWFKGFRGNPGESRGRPRLASRDRHRRRATTR